MWFVWGGKHARKRVGIVADYCPLCHESRAFVLSRLVHVTQGYSVAGEQSAPVGHVITCRDCGVELDSEPSRYSSVLRREPADVRALMAETNPALPGVERAEREQVRRLQSGETPGRLEAIVRPLYLVAVAFERRKLAMKAGILGFLVLLSGCVLLAIWLGNAFDPLAGLLILAALLALVIGRLTDTRRYVASVALPALKCAFVPLKPRRDELAAALGRISEMNLRLGTRFSPTELQRRLTQ